MSVALAGALVAGEFPQWATLALSPAGAGTDNTIFRLGGDLVLRMPRTPGTAAALIKEQKWLPRLAPHLPLAIPEPIAAGQPALGYPHPWAVYRWLDGREPSAENVQDWPSVGRALAHFVRCLQHTDLMGARRGPGLDNYRGSRFANRPAWARTVIADSRDFPDPQVDLDRVEAMIDAADAAGSPRLPAVWLHGDLRPANLLVCDGRLTAVIDFGGLCIGDPSAEHAPVWDLPRTARDAYREALDVDDDMWLRAAAWSLVVGLSGSRSYRETWPDFAADCRHRVREILADPSVLA